MTIYPGNPYPLGSFWDGKGVNFSLYSHNANEVELCLFNAPKGQKEVQRIKLTEDERDNAEVAPKSIVIDHHFDWEDDRPTKSVIWSRRG